MGNPLRIAVVGAGQMGTGFAIHFWRYDQNVTLIDHRQSNLDDARERIRDAVEFLNTREVMSTSADTILDEVEFTLDATEGVSSADLVLETVSEDLEVKREVFEIIGESAPSEAILATNTSSLPITDIADGFEFANRVVGCHWLYPPYLLPTVEVIEGEETATWIVDDLTAFLEAVDRIPIHVRRDVPGFVWNRVQFAVVRECMHIVENGVASIEDVNTAIRDGYARRTAVIGPFETMDIAGIDLFHTVASQLYPELDNATQPNDLFTDYLEASHTGIEDGEGFFSYDQSPDAVTRDRDDGLIAIQRALENRDT